MEEEKADPEYFESILNLLERMDMFADQASDTLELLKMDLTFLKVLCMCLETWDYSTEKEESMKIMTCIVTPLKAIWPKEHKALSILNRLAKSATRTPETETMLVEDFHSAVYELEAKIQQSKLLLEPWCDDYLMHSSMQFKFSTISSCKIIRKLLRLLFTDMVGKIIPFKEQHDILRRKSKFLIAKLEQVEDRVEVLLSTKESLEFLSFSCVFANKAACLICLYWAKESNEQIATEMNIVLFNMLQRYIPSAPDITPLFVGILKSHDSLLPGQELEVDVVEFFFGHLTSILKDDDFQILQAELVFLLNFLVDPSCENAEQDSIRSQVYALFREDAYLHLPFDQMNDDFSDKKMLLGDCVIRIDLAESRIEQLDDKFSDSWISVDIDNLVLFHFTLLIRELVSAMKYAWWADSAMDRLQFYIMELRLLKMSLLRFKAWDATEEEISARLESMITNLQGIWGKGLFAHRVFKIRSGVITDWHPLALELEKKICLSKIEIHDWSVDLFHQPLQCNPPTSYALFVLLKSIIVSLQDLVKFKLGEIVTPYGKQIETLEAILVFLKNLFQLSANCPYSKELEEFKLLVQVFANGAAFLTSHYSKAEAKDEKTNDILSRMMKKIKPDTPDVARLYFGILEAIYVQRSDPQIFGETVSKFADFFLEDSTTPWKYEFQILRDDIILLLTFLNDPRSENTEEVIGSRCDALFWEDAYGFLPCDDDGEMDFINKKVCLNDFMMKIGSINAIIIKTFDNFPDKSRYNFPKLISPLFLDSMIQSLESLKERLITDLNYAPFARYKIINIVRELVYLRPLFNSFFNLQSEVLDQTWFEVVDSLHLTEHVVSSCISSCFIFDHPIWYHMAHLSIVFDDLKGVKAKLERIKLDDPATIMHDASRLPRSTDLITTHSEQAKPSKINEIVVGFDGEADTIIENITHGSMSLDVVSIVGMGGLGKTTLAKKVYNSLLRSGSFVAFSFSYVSQDLNSRRILLDILGDVMGVDSQYSDMTDDDLAHRLWQGLSGRKYLIVLDDIWSESAWYKVRASFPDDKNASRVVFTTRSREVANNCKISCSPHQLRLLSEVESWELLQKKVFLDGKTQPYLSEIGKLIAKNCKGLPLAISVIAGLLVRTDKNLTWWSEVAERVVSYASEEGCSKILELSYKHVPLNLRPCLVYLGAFPEDRLIKVKNVILLWIAEGFIKESKTKNIQDVGKEYIQNLADRSLIIVAATGSTGDIKEFRVHDLIRDLCQTKCRDGNFLQINHGIGIASSTFSNPSTNHYRISMLKESDFTIATAGSSLSNARSLLFLNEEYDAAFVELPYSELRHAKVLNLEFARIPAYTKQLSTLVHLRHICAHLTPNPRDFLSSISNLWNLSSDNVGCKKTSYVFSRYVLDHE